MTAAEWYRRILRYRNRARWRGVEVRASRRAGHVVVRYGAAECVVSDEAAALAVLESWCPAKPVGAPKGNRNAAGPHRRVHA